VLLQRALAAREAGSADARALAARLGARFALAHHAGSPTELRDEAEYQLRLGNDATSALRLALENFATQRDREDQELLEAAAAEAGRPQALDGLRTWARAERIPLASAKASSR
jgi:hypothetical protein